MHPLLWNRFTITLGVIVATVALWNGYIALNDDGRITGRVLDERREPVPGARVSIESAEINNLSYGPLYAETDAQGRFRFEGVALFNFDLGVTKPGYEPVSRQFHHLYFRAQNYDLPAPVVLKRAAGNTGTAQGAARD